jgi:hypothetical protein
MYHDHGRELALAVKNVNFIEISSGLGPINKNSQT